MIASDAQHTAAAAQDSRSPQAAGKDLIFLWFGALPLLWTAFVALALWWNLGHIRDTVRALARVAARASFEKDVLYRQWATLHGGVYVPVTDQTPPNPYLTNLAERDITTPSGRPLTLMNPAYMTRQVHELGRAHSGPSGHIPSLKPIRPANAPDAWERRALEAFERGAEEVSSVEFVEGTQHLRLMRPLTTVAGCLKCHAVQGYKEGDIRGGISVAVPMQEYEAVVQPHQRMELLAHGVIWGVGMVLFSVSGGQIQRRRRERASAQAALLGSEARYRSLFAAGPDAVFVVDATGRFLDCNETAERRYGYTRAELLQMGAQDLAAPALRDQAAGRIQSALASGVAFEWRQRCKDGTELPVEISAKPFELAGQRCVLSSVRDITTRKRLETERDRLFNLSLDMLCVAGFDGYFKQLNPAWRHTLGWTETELASKPWLEFVHPEDRARTAAALAQLVADQPVLGFENRYQCKDGSYRWISWNAFPLSAEQQTFAVARDVTERKRVETERQKFVQLADSSSEFIGMCDLDLKPLFVNPAGVRMVGLPDMAAACRVEVQDYFFPEDRRFITEEFFPRVLREGHGDVEIRLRHFQTGEPIWMFYYLFSVRDASGTAVGWATVSRDITERRRVERELIESERRYRALFETMTAGFVVFEVVQDEQGVPVDLVILAANQGFEKTTGLKARQVIGQRLTQVLPGIEKDAADWIGTYGKVALTGEARWFEQGSELLGNCYAVTAYQAAPRQCAVTFDDITERKRAETQLREQLEELRRWQAVMLDHSDRSQELKREVNELARRLGEPVRYPSQAEGAHERPPNQPTKGLPHEH